MFDIIQSFSSVAKVDAATKDEALAKINTAIKDGEFRAPDSASAEYHISLRSDEKEA